jgi:hypothetical protein
VHLTLEPDLELDPEESERLTRQLRAELAELDVESVDAPVVGMVPEGAKGDPVAAGALLVALSAPGGVLVALIETVRDFLARHSASHRIVVTIGGDTIELDRASAAQESELVDAFVRRHAVP